MRFCLTLVSKLKKIRALLKSLLCCAICCSSVLSNAEEGVLLFSKAEKKKVSAYTSPDVNLSYKQVQRADHQKELYVLDNMAEKYKAHLESVYNLTPLRAAEIVSAALLSSKEHNVDPSLIFAVIKVESRFDRTVNAGYGTGLMQIVSKAHPEKMARIGGRHKLLEVGSNVDVGTEILAEYIIKAKGSVPRALQYYNGTITDPSKTYSRKVLTAQKEFIKIQEL